MLEYFKLSQTNKYRLGWIIGIFVSFLLYYTGIFWIYNQLAKKIFKNNRILVITYHRIRDDNIDRDISVSIKNFEKQMKYLANNYNIISIDDLLKNINRHKINFLDNIAITFDDGFKDNYTNAYPILKKYRLPITIFLISGILGKDSNMLSISDIIEMKKHCINFGSHTRTHNILSNIGDNQLTEEISESKEYLENLINEKILYFAYPQGKNHHFNTIVKSLVKNAGYKAAFTMENKTIDLNSDMFALPRIGIRNCPLFVFKVRVSGIYESKILLWIRELFGLT